MKRHSRVVCRILRGISPTRGAEIGVWQGTTSLGLLQTYPDLVLYMIDPWEKVVGIETMPKSKDQLLMAKATAIELTEFAKNRRIIILEISEEAVKQIEDKSLDFVFIDGNHLYEFVKKDIELWFPKVRCGGIVAGHDYGGRGDRVCGWGVKKAVDEYCEGQGICVEVETHTVWWFKV